MDSTLTIRPEQVEDHPAVYWVESAAFPTAQEARLVDRLRSRVDDAISLVAATQAGVVGHILFTPVVIHGRNLQTPAMGLGPMAVLPEFQRQGVGSRLVRAGLRACTDKGILAVFVIGPSEYYRRFGFEPAGPRGFHHADRKYDPYLFVLELQEDALAHKQGRVAYHPEFDSLD